MKKNVWNEEQTYNSTLKKWTKTDDVFEDIKHSKHRTKNIKQTHQPTFWKLPICQYENDSSTILGLIFNGFFVKKKFRTSSNFPTPNG